MELGLIILTGVVLAMILFLGKKCTLPESFSQREYERAEKLGNERLEKKRNNHLS